jgi:lysozyme
MNWYNTYQINEITKEAQNNSGWSNLLSTYGIKAIMMLASLWGINELGVQEAFAKQPQKVVQELEKNKQKDVKNDKTTQSFSFQQIKEMITRHEGKKNKAYKSNGVWHIGVGCNLQREFMADRLSKTGLNMKDVINGKIITEKQIEQLFQWDLQDVKRDVQTLIPSFSSQPEIIQAVLMDMAFNMGARQPMTGNQANGLAAFSKFLQAINKKDYKTAVKEMENSKWYKQVPNRAKELVDLMKRAG